MTEAAIILASGDGVRQIDAPVRSNESAGAYRRLTLAAPNVHDLARPGQFAALAVGDETTGLFLRRSFSIHRVTAEDLEIVVADAGPGTRWIMGRRPGDRVNVLVPLGRSFPMPDEPGDCLLVGGGYGSAPLFWFADDLRAAGHRVHLVLGAARADRLFGVDLAPAHADTVTVTTDDGSSGTTGLVTSVLPDLLRDSGSRVVYACGPMGMLRAVTDLAHAHGARAFVAVEEAMACGVGVCMTCVLPVVGADGATRMTRSCLDGPVFDGGSVRWEAIAGGRVAVPDDAVGAPTPIVSGPS